MLGDSQEQVCFGSEAVLVHGMQVTSVLGDTVTDTIGSTSGRSGTAQFRAHAVSPPAPDAASESVAAPSTVAAGGRRLQTISIRS